jgi:hypothetical protein
MDYDSLRRKWEAELFPRPGELLRYFSQRQPGHVGAMMPQEELDRFPQSRLAEFANRLRVFLHRHMQGIVRREDSPGRYEAFQLGRRHGFDGFRIV